MRFAPLVQALREEVPSHKKDRFDVITSDIFLTTDDHSSGQWIE